MMKAPKVVWVTVHDDGWVCCVGNIRQTVSECEVITEHGGQFHKYILAPTRPRKAKKGKRRG